MEKNMHNGIESLIGKSYTSIAEEVYKTLFYILNSQNSYLILEKI